MVNNIIDDVEIVCLGHFGAMLTLELKMRKHWNVFGLCNATANCGLILRELAIFFDVVEEDGSDVIDALRGQPCRVLELFTAQIVKPEHTFIGRFMDDSFIWAADQAKLGFDEGGK